MEQQNTNWTEIEQDCRKLQQELTHVYLQFGENAGSQLTIQAID